jgi:Fic family protein
MELYEKIRGMWGKNKIVSVEALEYALDNFRILFAYHSGKIENEEIEYYDTRDIFDNGKISGYTGSTKAIFEQQNQKLCYDYLKEKIVQQEPMSIPLILEVHSILTSGTYDERRYIANNERPGQFKKHDYVTGRDEVGFPPEEVEKALHDLICELNEYSGKDILKAVSYFHLRFEHIHPFADGNGRVGRTLMNYYLLTHGEPPVIIFNEDKRKYYDALEAYDTSEDINPLYKFLKEQTEKTWEKAYKRVKGNTSHNRKTLNDIDAR